MNAPSLPTLLTRGRNWLWLQLALALLRRAALLGLALGMLLLAAHLLLQALPARFAMAAFALPLLGACLLAWRRRPSRSAAAVWLDRNLATQDAFSTHLEFIAERRTSAGADALQAFARWSDTVLARLASRAVDLPPLRAARTGAFLVLAALPPVAMLVLPGRETATAAASNTAAAQLPAAASSESSDRSVLSALRGTGAAQRRADTPGAKSGNAATSVVGAAPIAMPAPPPGSPQTIAGSARVDGTGARAGDNAASALPREAATAGVSLQARFRDLAGRRGDGAGSASGQALAIEVSARAQDAAEFDRRQALLAQQTPAARLDSALRQQTDGPAQLALLTRFSRLRDIQ